MSMANPIHSIIWQFIQVFKEEAMLGNFTREQKDKLLALTAKCEENYTSMHPRKQHKSNMSFARFEVLFVEYGGDMERLNLKVNDVYGQIDPTIRKVGSMVTGTAIKMSDSLSIKAKISGLTRRQ